MAGQGSAWVEYRRFQQSRKIRIAYVSLSTAALGLAALTDDVTVKLGSSIFWIMALVAAAIAVRKERQLRLLLHDSPPSGPEK
jgi:hypothetical protein